MNDTLKELGIPKMYQRMHIWTVRIVIGWIVYSVALTYYDFIWWYDKKATRFWGVVLAVILNYCYHINAFVDLLFIFFLWFV